MMKLALITGTEIRFCFHTLFFNINAICPPLRLTLYARHVKLFTEASEPLTHAVSARRLPQDGVLGVYPSGAQKHESRSCQIETAGRIRTWFVFLSGRTLRIRCFNRFNVALNRLRLLIQEFHRQDAFTVPEEASNDFTIKRAEQQPILGPL